MVWTSVLHIDEGLIGIDNDFYASGGDSISAIRLSSAARKAGLTLLATDIIRNPTIRTMAEVASSRINDEPELDDDEITSTLDHMSLSNLSLLDIDQSGLDSLCRTLLLTHGLSSK